VNTIQNATDVGDDDKADRLIKPMEEMYRSNDTSAIKNRQTQYGSDPYRLFPILQELAEAHEAADQWEKAVACTRPC
jgi:hypothetical protein